MTKAHVRLRAHKRSPSLCKPSATLGKKEDPAAGETFVLTASKIVSGSRVGLRCQYYWRLVLEAELRGVMRAAENYTVPQSKHPTTFKAVVNDAYTLSIVQYRWSSHIYSYLVFISTSCCRLSKRCQLSDGRTKHYLGILLLTGTVWEEDQGAGLCNLCLSLLRCSTPNPNSVLWTNKELMCTGFIYPWSWLTNLFILSPPLSHMSVTQGKFF
jgi:hypothetical protein